MVSRFMNRNSVRSRPMPAGAGLGDQRQLERQFQIGLQFDRLAVRGFGRQPAQPGHSAAARARRRSRARRAAARSGGEGLSDDGAGGAVHHSHVARTDGMRQPGHAEHGRHAQGAQHHRGVAVGAAFLGGDAGQPRRVQQRRVGRAQRIRRPGSRPRAGRRSCGTGRGSGCGSAGGRSPALPRRGGAGWRVSSAVRPGSAWSRMAAAIASDFVDHGAFGREQRLLDAPPGAAHQARGAEHPDIGVDQRGDFRLAFLRQHGQPGAQLAPTACATGRWRLPAGRPRRRCRRPGSSAG